MEKQNYEAKMIFVSNLDLSENTAKLFFYIKWVFQLEKVKIFPVKTKICVKKSSSSQAESIFKKEVPEVQEKVKN